MSPVHLSVELINIYSRYAIKRAKDQISRNNIDPVSFNRCLYFQRISGTTINPPYVPGFNRELFFYAGSHS